MPPSSLVVIVINLSDFALEHMKGACRNRLASQLKAVISCFPASCIFLFAFCQERLENPFAETYSKQIQALYFKVSQVFSKC